MDPVLKVIPAFERSEVCFLVPAATVCNSGTPFGALQSLHSYVRVCAYVSHTHIYTHTQIFKNLNNNHWSTEHSEKY